jgi:hypothetical protein
MAVQLASDVANSAARQPPESSPVGINDRIEITRANRHKVALDIAIDVSQSRGHWGLPDRVKATGTDAEKALAFVQTYSALRRRIMIFVELPFESFSRMSLQSRVDAIGSDAQTKV